MHTILRIMALACLSAISLGVMSSRISAAERPTLVRTCDPRPDIIPRPFYENSTEYRAAYNRPRYLVGKLAWYTSRTSQEAMVWEENYCAGNYECKDMPPVCKRYMYPKPWEILNTGPRFDTHQKPSLTRSESAADAVEEEPSKEEESSSRKNEESKSDNDSDVTAKDANSEATKKAGVKNGKSEKLVVPSPSNR